MPTDTAKSGQTKRFSNAVEGYAFSDGVVAEGNVDHEPGPFTNEAGAAFDPTIVTVKVRKPGGGITTKVYGTDTEVKKAATGIYYMDVTFDDTEGTWELGLFGSGTKSASDWIPVKVEKSPFV